jgi:hypothetical protein
MAEAATALAFPELVLGRYRPFRPLGSGGSGSVWLARDEQTGLDVALKIIAREGKAAVRAEREAAAAAQLRHPACLRAYGFAHDERHVYIAYEFIPGRTFREALRARQLSDDAAIEACAQVCDGLAHAHAAGILHRDIKPSNVLLEEGDRVTARVLDFGLAQMAEAETLTEQGDVPGTLAYISPERLAGQPATEAADVWAVGVMLWEALGGRHPFWRGSMLETARAIESGARPLAEVRPGLPKRLLRLVDRALAQDPRKRPSARDLAEELRGISGAAKPSRRANVSVTLATPPNADRFVTAGLAGVFAGWTAGALPFFPHGWAIGLGLVAAALTLTRERAGLALALAVPILPLGNTSSGAALLYTAVAVLWLVATWKEPRATLLFALAPLLAPLGALPLLPVAASRVGNGARRACVVAIGVLTAVLVAGVRHASLPLIGGAAPHGAGTGHSTGPLDVAGSLARAAGAHPALLVETAVLALVAFAIPHLRGRGLWPAAGLGAGMLTAGVLALPAGASLTLVASLVVCAWAIAGFTALRSA